MRALNHPDVSQFDLAGVLQALGDPVRLHLLRQLQGCGELTCGCFDVELQKSALSHHFRVLRDAGLIHVRIDGKRRFMTIRREEMDARFPGLLAAVLGAEASANASLP